MSRPLDRLTLLETFVRIAERGGISAAARDLGLSQSSASRRLHELETRLGTTLVQRTTHSLALSEAGEALLVDARELLDGWTAVEERHSGDDDTVRGTLKAVVPVALGQRHLATVACELQREHPDLALDWRLADGPIRFAEVGCDCWVKVGPFPDERLVVREIARVERLLVASPGYLDEAGRPRTPRAVERHRFLALAPFEGGVLPLSRRRDPDDTTPTVVRARARVTTDDVMALRTAALSGLGLAVLPRWLVADDLAAGTLVDAMPAWRAPTLPIGVATLPGRHRPRRLSLFLDRLQTRLPALLDARS